MASKTEQEVLQKYGVSSVEELAAKLEAAEEKAAGAEEKAKQAAAEVAKAEEDAEVQRAKLAAVQRDAEASARRMANRPAKERRVRLMVPISDMNPHDTQLSVTVNGRTYTIIRGEEVEVPASVAEVIRHSEEQAKALRALQAQTAFVG